MAERRHRYQLSRVAWADRARPYRALTPNALAFQPPPRPIGTAVLLQPRPQQ